MNKLKLIFITVLKPNKAKLRSRIELSELLKNITIFFLITIVIICIDTITLIDVIKSVYPLGDEYSLSVESLKNPTNWFTKGYSEYFIPYPEFTTAYTNFIRPTANFIYYLFSNTSKPYLSQLIVVNYSVHAMICALLFLATKATSNSASYKYYALVIAFLAPCFWITNMVNLPSFVLDGLATLLCLISVLAFYKNKVIACLVFLLFAIFTKETALPIAAAFMIFGLFQRNKPLFFGSFILLSSWLLIRWLAFDNLSGGVYSFNDFGINQVSIRLASLTTLPIAYSSTAILKLLVLEGKLDFSLLFFITNACVWICGLLYVIKQKLFTPLSFATKSKILLKTNNPFKTLIFLCLLFSILYYVLINGSTRFSYIILTFWLLYFSFSFKDSSYLKYMAGIMLFSSLAGFIYNIKSVSKLEDLEKFKYLHAKEHIKLISKINNNKKNYIINDFTSGYSKQDNVTKFANSKSIFIRANSININSCSISELDEIVTEVSVNLDQSSIKVHIPPCARFVFEGANNSLILSSLKGNKIYRNKDLQYEFPSLMVKVGAVSKLPYIDYGSDMIILLKETDLVYFDFKEKKWNYKHL